MSDVLLASFALMINALGAAFVASQVVLARRSLIHAQATRAVETLRRKREATIDLYITTVEQRRHWRSELPDDWDGEAIGKFVADAFRPGNESQLHCLTDYLGYYEIMAVGVGSGVYDIEVLDNVAGNRLRSIALNYRPYFNQVRERTGAASLFREFEWLGERLAAIRGPEDPYQLATERFRTTE